MKILIKFLIVFIIGCCPPALWAQASVNVSTMDPVYRDIDKLVANGLVKKIIMGQRPFSRREIARIIGEASLNLKVLKAHTEDLSLPDKKRKNYLRRFDYVQRILNRLKRDYQEELIQLGYLKGNTKWYSLHPFEKAEFDFTALDSPPRNIPANGLGSIDAEINPLAQYRQGQHIINGSNLSMETTHWFRLSDYFALYVRPRFQLSFGRDGKANDNGVYVQNLYGKIFVKNFEIEVGRDNLFYGQGREAGLLLSNNPRGLDMVKISNDIPFFFPWVFKYMGANKFSFFYSDLGPEQNFPNDYLVGYKWSLQPVSFFELGFAFVTQGGGQGSPPGSLGQRIKDVFPFSQNTDVAISNKLGGFDSRFRIPSAKGLELYFEGIFDDSGNGIKFRIQHDLSYIVGIYFPRLDQVGKIDLRLEYHNTGDRFYRHGQFTSGYTLNKLILGDNLGPDAFGFYTNLNWEINDNNILIFDGAFESRSNDIIDPIDFKPIIDLPDELRFRGVFGWLFQMREYPLLIRAWLGYERVENFNFVSGDSLDNFLGRILIEYKFDQLTRFPKKFN